MIDDEAPLRERLARIEAKVDHLTAESAAVRNSLHTMIQTALSTHEAAIGRLSVAHDQRTGIWWTAAWILGGLVILVGAATWLIEHQVQIIIKP